jgi:enoyl-CoA hydratase/carnithine racemase
MTAAPVNGIGPRLLEDLHQAATLAEQDESVAAVVLTSGLDVFSAGADAKWMGAELTRSGPDALLPTFIRTMDRFRDLALRLRRAPYLTVAAVQGHALAGGLELAAACDLRWCSDDPNLQLGVPEMALFGQLPSGGGGTQVLARLLGPSRALDLVLGAHAIDPTRAAEIGLVDRVLPNEQLMPTLLAHLTSLAEMAGRVAINAAKRSAFDGASLSLADGLVMDRAVHWDSMRRGRFAETVTRFVEEYA